MQRSSNEYYDHVCIFFCYKGRELISDLVLVTLWIADLCNPNFNGKVDMQYFHMVTKRKKR